MQGKQAVEQRDAFKYWAFISYSHHDWKWATWLHRSLDTYRVPKKLVGKTSEDGPLPRRLFPIFRDREELAASPNLPDRITEALKQSRYLIVICSPHATRSQWVNEEVKAFKRLGREDRVLGLIVDGEPNASNGIPGVSTNQECFPELMRYRIAPDGTASSERVQPLAPDVRAGKDGRANARLKLLAGILRVDFDTLKRREHERWIRRLIGITAGAVSLIAVFAILGVKLSVQIKGEQQALTNNFFNTIGVASKEVPTPDEREALWELAQITRANAPVRDKLLDQWFETADAFSRGEAHDGRGFRAAIGLNLEYHRVAISRATELGRHVAAVMADPTETGPDRLERLGSALAALAAKMDPPAATEIIRPVAQRLAAALQDPQETDPTRTGFFRNDLVALAAKMDPQATAELVQGFVKAMQNPQGVDSSRLSNLGVNLAALCVLLPSAHHTHLLALSNLLLKPVSIEEGGVEVMRPDDWKLFAAVCAQLPKQHLAEVLKYPFCTGEAERIVLDAISPNSGGNVWKFAEQADALGIKDIGRPAQRPSVQEALKELDGLKGP